MAQITSDIEDTSKEEHYLQSGDPDLDFEKARMLAKEKALQISSNTMMLSWCNGKTGEYYPRTECVKGDKPSWVVFAESRGGNLTINVDDGAFIFMYLKL